MAVCGVQMSPELFRTFAGLRGLLVAGRWAIVARIFQTKQARSLQQGKLHDEHPTMLFHTFSVESV